jgi:tetratricopeptide (TPR) repeat protein
MTNPSTLILLLALAITAPRQFASASELAFTNATVIDVTGGSTKRNATLLVSGDRISALGKDGDVRIPKNAHTVDATGKFIIPGLWDMHVHWYDSDYLPLFLANGVTGVRQMWGVPLHYEWRKKIGNGLLLGPRMCIASTIVDGPNPIWPGSIIASNADEGRKAVIRAKEEGADFVKVYSMLPRDAYFAIADEARKQLIPFSGHVPESISFREASQAGQSSIEHLTRFLVQCCDREAELLKATQEASLTGTAAVSNNLQLSRLALESFSETKAKALFADLKKNQTWQCPTLTVLRNISHLDDAAITNDSRLKFVPKSLATLWDPSTDFRFKSLKPEDLALKRAIYEKQLQIVGSMQRAGVGILAGTDTLNPYCFPGFSLHDELNLLVQAGLTPVQALRAATVNAARFMQRERDLGTVEQGKLADLVLLDADPEKDITNTRKIAAVVFGGKFLPKSSLDQILGKAEALSSKISIATALTQTIKEKDVEAAIKQYRTLRAEKPNDYDFREGELDMLAGQLLSDKKTKDAIQIFKLNVEAYPQSSTAYESLGDAYQENADQELAIQCYEKSIALSSDNKPVTQKLKALTRR